MQLKDYLRSLPDDEAREAFAVACKTTLGHLRNCIYVKGKYLSPASVVLAEQVSARKLRRWDLRPHDWHEIWPELRRLKGAPAVAEKQAA